MIGDSVAAAVVSVFRGRVPPELRLAVDRETYRLEKLIEVLLEEERKRAPFVVEKLEARREVTLAGGTFELRIDRIDFIEGGGYAILDYKSGAPRTPRWQDESVRDPQLLAYLLAERGRNVQALANVSLANGRAKFCGKSAHKRLLPGVNGMPGMDPNKVPPEQIAAAWQAQLERWLHGVKRLAANYIAGAAPVQPAPDVCRNCHLTTLCRRVELAALDAPAESLDV
jgi:ATP-dependent helicase/nuclease subunit B